MTPQERSAAIYLAIEKLIDTLEDLKVESSIIAVAIDETPGTGYGTSRVKGNSNIVLEQIATAAGSLPPREFFIPMSALATSPVFASNRGEDPNVAAKPQVVN